MESNKNKKKKSTLKNQKWEASLVKLLTDFKKEDLWSIPNILCYIRILLIPVFVILYIKAESSRDYFRAASVILISGITDFLDGFIARNYNMVTQLGKLIDPIADKLTQAALIFVLVVRIRWMYLLLILFAALQMFLVIAGLAMLKKEKILDGSKWFGKISTTAFYAVMLVLVAFPSLPINVINTLMFICGIFLAMSLLLYIREYLFMYRDTKTENKEKVGA